MSNKKNTMKTIDNNKTNNRNVALQNSGAAIGYYIEKFPKELKRNFFKSLDKTFYAILALSFIINSLVVIMFGKMTTYEIDSKAINKIQKQYANLLLETDFNNANSARDLISSDYRMDEQVISGLTQLMNDLTFDIFGSLEDMAATEAPPLELAVKESRGYTREEMADMRKNSDVRRTATREELESEIGSVGLLRLIASKSNNVDHEYVQDLLEYASQNTEQLTQVLAKLNTIEVPRYGNTRILRGGGSSGNSGGHTSLKGGRKTADGEINAIVKNIQSLEKPKTETVARNIQYEEVKSSYLNKPSRSGFAGVKRNSKDVVQTVRSHMRALQDCYKQQLKKNPGLKGKIIVRFTINPAGSVIFASVVSSTFNNQVLESCIVKRVRQWRDFPPSDPSFGNNTYRQSFKFGM